MIEESVPENNYQLADARDELKNKRGLRKLLESLHEHGCDKSESSCHIVLESKHPSGADLIAMGHRCNSKVTLSFAMTKNAGSTRKGSPYEMKFADSHGNARVRLVDRPSAMSEFFEDSSVADRHDQARQHKLGLEKNRKQEIPASG